MFFRNQDVIDKFDANFREAADGQILFQPNEADVGMPVSCEEYQAVMADFERVHTRGMVFMWIALFGAAAYGVYMVIAENSYISFLYAFGAATIFIISMGARDGMKVLKPIIDRRNDQAKMG